MKRKLRVFITNQYFPGKLDSDNDEDFVPQWELKIEGRLMDDVIEHFSYFFFKMKINFKNSSFKILKPKTEATSSAMKSKPRKFSSFFKSLVIELDRNLYGPDNYLVEVSLPLLLYYSLIKILIK